MNANSLLKLLQITSPSLPVGSYSYSQGLEWSVEAGWISNRRSFQQWVSEQLDGTMAQQELPLLLRIYHALSIDNHTDVTQWDKQAIAVRETSELRNEDTQRARALWTLLKNIGFQRPQAETESQLSPFAYFCLQEGISANDTLYGYTYSWLDNQVTAGIKLVPLGQSDGQTILYELGNSIQQAVDTALSVSDENIGYSSPALAMASCCHETQYCRLFRS